MQHPSLLVFIVCLLFAARSVSLRRLKRSIQRHHGGLACGDGRYYSRPTRSCEPCWELCHPQRGTQRQCQLRCKGFKTPTVITVPSYVYEKEATTQETTAQRPTAVGPDVVDTVKTLDEAHRHGSKGVQEETGVGFTIWQIAEVIAFGVIVSVLAVLGYCYFQGQRQIKQLWKAQDSNFSSPGPTTSTSQPQPSSVHVHVAGSTATSSATTTPGATTMSMPGDRTCPSNTVPIYATDTKPPVSGVQNDLVEEDHMAEKQMASMETEN